jgi:ABC-type uncharacterized transport system involved in gliding motility auxiliary subunit/ABC-type transport system involved in multi-copper enzyme maturation permease subunit
MNGSRRQIAILWLKDARHFVFSPLALASILFFSLGTGIPFFFSGISVTADVTAFRQFMALVPWISAIVISATTMGLWADEEKAGTGDLIRSFPVRESSIIAAKFFSAFSLYVFCLALMMPVVIFSSLAGPASRFVHSGLGAVFSAYIMLCLWGAAAISAGIFFSVFFRNAAASFFASTAALLAFSWFSARHLDAAARGILDTRDALFFLVPCACALYAGTAMLSRLKGRAGGKKVSHIILFFVSCLILLPLASARFHARLDLTDSKLHTLAPFTREVLSKLESEVRVTWYRSADLEKFTPNARSIDDFLDEYRAASNGMFSYVIADPTAENATAIEALGIASRQIAVNERDAAGTRNIYSGILVEHNGSTRVIPFVADQSTIEYDITRFIADTGDTSETAFMQKNEISLVYGNPGGADFYPYVAQALSFAGFNVRVQPLPASSLDPAKSLVVLGSSLVDAGSAGAIASFLDAGGSAVFFASGATVNTGSDWKAYPKTQDNLLATLARYGIVIEPNLVLDESNWPLTMPSADKTKYETVQYPFWVRTRPDALAKKSVMLNGTDSLQFYWPSSILIDSSVDRTIAPLAESSGKSIVMEPPFDTGPFGKQLELVEKSAGKSRSKLAVVSTLKGRVVCVADEYFASAMLDYTASGSNITFLVSAVEWATGRDRLLELKKTPASLGPVTAEETALIQSYFGATRIVMLAVIPFAVLASGAVLLAFRRKKR